MKKFTLLLCIMVFPIVLFAEGRILGRVTNQNDLPVSDITVRVKQGQSFWKGCKTNSAGFFVIDEVPAGKYDVAAYKKGDIRAWYGSVEVMDGGVVRFNIEVKSLNTTKPSVANQENQ